MDVQKVGIFIKFLREKQGLTQAQLASRLNLTDKAISKWESGLGLPDTVFFPQLALLFGVSTDELLSGERQDRGGIKTKFELAMDFDNLKMMESFLENENLFDVDEKGNHFLYYVVLKNKAQLIPFCHKKGILKITSEGIIIDSNGSNQYDKELAIMIISNFLTLDWRRNETGISDITQRKYSIEELSLIVEIAKNESTKLNKPYEIGYIYWFLGRKSGSEIIPNPHIVELTEMLFIELKLHQWIPAVNFLESISKILIPNHLILSDNLIEFFINNMILFLEKPGIAKSILTNKSYQLFKQSQLSLGNVDNLIGVLNIYEEYKNGNWEYIEKIIDRKNTATELYSIKGFRRLNIESSYSSNGYSRQEMEVTIPGKESDYLLAKFFNEDYPDVVELIIRKNKGIPEDRPTRTQDGELSIKSTTSGMSVKFIRVLFESLINKVAKLENEIKDLKNNR